MFDDHYDEWRSKRIAAIEDYYGSLFFKGKTILEIGCGYGDIGGYFTTLGADVTCSDAVEEYLVECINRYPNVKTIRADLDKEWPPGSYDIIFHMGVLYHLGDYKKTIKEAAKHCKYLVLETEVLNSSKINHVNTEEDGYDQAFNKVGSRPSAKAVEKELDTCGFTYERIQDDRCNAGYHCYDWEVDDNDNYQHGLRRFWFCQKACLSE